MWPLTKWASPGIPDTRLGYPNSDIREQLDRQLSSEFDLGPKRLELAVTDRLDSNKAVAQTCVC